MVELSKQKCKPYEGGVKPLTFELAEPYLKMVPEWKRIEEYKIEREFKFRDFSEALDFVNKVGAIAESEGHHPNISIYDYKKVRLTLWTHAIDELSINDFIVASKVDRIL